MLHEFVAHTKEHEDETDGAKQDEMKKGSFESWMSCLCVAQASADKCGSLVEGFNTQCSLENNQFPKTMTRASDVSSDHKLDEAWRDKLKKKKDKDKEKKSNWNNDHNNENDTKNTNNNEEQEQEKLDTSFRQQGDETTCHVCGEHNHLATECGKWETTPKSQWWSTKFKQFMQTKQEETVEAAAVAETTSQAKKALARNNGGVDCKRVTKQKTNVV